VRALAGPAKALAAAVRAYERNCSFGHLLRSAPCARPAADESDRGLGHGGTTLPPSGGIYKWRRSLLQARSFYLLKGTEIDPGSLRRIGAALTTPGAASSFLCPISPAGKGEEIPPRWRQRAFMKRGIPSLWIQRDVNHRSQ
jgi:hypothetical protein